MRNPYIRTDIRPAGQILPPGQPRFPVISLHPIATLDAPPNGASFPPLSRVTIQAGYTTGEGYLPIKRIDFIVDGNIAATTNATDSAAPSKIAMTDPLGPGQHTIFVRVTDQRGTTADSPIATITIGSVSLPVPGNPTPVPVCPTPPALLTQADVDAWNVSHPGCPPVSLPVVGTATGVPTWAWVAGGIALAAGVTYLATRRKR